MSVRRVSSNGIDLMDEVHREGHPVRVAGSFFETVRVMDDRLVGASSRG